MEAKGRKAQQVSPSWFNVLDHVRCAIAQAERDQAFYVAHQNLTKRTVRFNVQQDNPGFWYRVTPLKVYIPGPEVNAWGCSCPNASVDLHFTDCSEVGRPR